MASVVKFITSPEMVPGVMLLMLTVVSRVSFGAPVGDAGEARRSCSRQMQVLRDNWDKILPKCEEQQHNVDKEKKDCDVKGNEMGLKDLFVDSDYSGRSCRELQGELVKPDMYDWYGCIYKRDNKTFNQGIIATSSLGKPLQTTSSFRYFKLMCEHRIKEEVGDGPKGMIEPSCVPKYQIIQVTLEAPNCGAEGKETRKIWWPATM
ncbi:uncharacterized protein LOC134842823 isoform X2 [Symsagittifera roscoffensis]|uniref:uncharacterized protein LOC134842823 isoform X2 n=1 Tax=Symsagittifera roscoffensis TaxID=84072 RepID=UPI00307B4323